ncbi:hypothetical protein [Photobacterium kishitanii]|uniref:Uncharacterized protein n=1 Tax=Photobacterium kishitanii TaxID=318456 RepID=A0A2T3KMD2_9GAMM|nr:hypothetical protein [Photobacterium kishitanii]PSV00960.1 hypothetical protein C9J27_02740 [Photobacterium kishitanii]
MTKNKYATRISKEVFDLLSNVILQADIAGFEVNNLSFCQRCWCTVVFPQPFCLFELFANTYRTNRKLLKIGGYNAFL